MRFEIELGLSSERGRRERNEDFAGVQAPASHERERGVVAALADGVGGGGDGLIAAQTTVMSLLRDFHATPAHWDASVALERLLQHQNSWLLAHNRRPAPDGQPREALCTLTAITLVGRRYAIAHVGDSRACLLRDGRCLQLTQDHRREGRDFAGLTRAMGLDEALHLEHSQGELRVGDRLLLSSDGLHGVLREREIAALLRVAPDAQSAAERLTAAALQAGSSDNVTALVIAIKDLAGADLDDLVGKPLPCPGLLGVGAQLDGFTITAVVADNGIRRLLQARDATGALVAIKLLHPSRAQDPEERAMLAHEIWLGQQIANQAGQKRRGLSSNPLVRLRQPDNPSAFYAVFDWHGGQTLEQLIATAPLEPAAAVDMAKACAQALSLLHAARCVHRDVKPANLHRGEDGVWRLLDLGVALSPRAPKSLAGLHAGTPAYVNPEQWDGEAPTPGSDLYALGITLYQALTGRLPFGELAPHQDSRKRKPSSSVTRLNPAVPMWLDRLVARAIAADAGQRFETAEEFLLELERGAARGLQTVMPRAPRDPLLPWQLGLGLSLLVNLLLIVWLLALPTS